MELYYSPAACSIGIHVLLEETGKPFTLTKIDLRKQAQLQPEFTRINPKSRVPTLRRDDDRLRQGRLPHADARRRTSEVRFLGNGEKVPEALDVHIDPISIMTGLILA